jgi:hypothetical protein
MRLDRILGIGEVAALAGWSRRRMLRHLLRLDLANEGRLLVNVGGGEKRPRWTVTLGALQRIAPQWFIDEESNEARIAELEERLAVYERVTEMHTARFETMRGTAA